MTETKTICIRLQTEFQSFSSLTILHRSHLTITSPLIPEQQQNSMNNAVATSIVFSDESFVYLDPTHPEHVETQQKNNSFSNSQKNLEISYYHDSLVKQLFIQEMSTRVTLSKKKNRRSRRIRYRFHLVSSL
ncbi:unnamed protein product [Lathyrus oleraceus]